MPRYLAAELDALEAHMEERRRETQRAADHQFIGMEHAFVVQQGERWRRLKATRGGSVYYVSNHGRIARKPSLHDCRLVDQYEAPDGIGADGRALTPDHMRAGHFRVHVEVARHFIGPRPPGKLVCHKDGNFRNNHVENLYYGTAQDNYDDAVRHGTRTRRRPPGCHSADLSAAEGEAT